MLVRLKAQLLEQFDIKNLPFKEFRWYERQ
jgi:hypothetical protein